MYELLTSSTLADLIALLIKNPNDKFYLREIAKLLKRNPSGIKRQIDKLEKIGIVFSEKLSNLKYFQINKTSPHYHNLKYLFSVDAGLVSYSSESELSKVKDNELLFMSSIRANLIALFIKNPDGKYYVREIAKLLRRNPSGVKRELDNLEKRGIIVSEKIANQRYLQMNKKSPYYLKLKNVISFEKEASNTSTEKTQEIVRDIVFQQKKHLIQNFLRGSSDKQPDTQELCDWITIAYENEMYEEGYELFKLIDETSLPSETFNKLRKIADACKVKLD